ERATPGDSSVPAVASGSVSGAPANPVCATDPASANRATANQTATVAALRLSGEAPPLRPAQDGQDASPMPAEPPDVRAAAPNGLPAAQAPVLPSTGTTGLPPAESSSNTPAPAVAVQATTDDDSASVDLSEETQSATPFSGERLALFAALSAATGG